MDHSPACSDNGCHDDRCPASNVRTCLRSPPTRTSQSTGHRNVMIPVRSLDLTFLNEFAGCNSRNFKTTAPAEISVTGTRIPAGTGAAAWKDHGAGRPGVRRDVGACLGNPDCIGMARRIALPGEEDGPGPELCPSSPHTEEIHRCRRLTTS